MKPLSRATIFFVAPLLISAVTSAAISADLSPYAGQQTREVKALSPQDREDLMKGRGMGLAKVGELNGYPGPAHILDMASQLKLTPEQGKSVASIMERMANAAKPLGTDIINRERQLQSQFVAGTITKAELTSETETIGALYGRLRSIHLAAHLEAKRVLTPEQVALYSEIRGYGSTDTAAIHGGMPGHHDMDMSKSHCDDAHVDHHAANAC